MAFGRPIYWEDREAGYGQPNKLGDHNTKKGGNSSRSAAFFYGYFQLKLFAANLFELHVGYIFLVAGA